VAGSWKDILLGMRGDARSGYNSRCGWERQRVYAIPPDASVSYERHLQTT